MTRLLVLAAEFPPAGGGGVTRMAKLVKYLARDGWSITVVCADEPSPAMLDKALLAEIPPTVVIRRVKGPFRFVGAAAPRVAAAGTAGAIRRKVVGALKAVVRAFAIPDRWIGWAWRVGRMRPEDLGDPEVILASGPPHSVHLAGARLSKRLKVPLVMDLRDTWYANPAYRSGAPWQAWFDRRLEARCVRRADAVVVVAPSSVAEYEARYPGKPVALIPNGFDPADFAGTVEPRSSPEAVELLHAGSLYARHGDAFFRAFGAAVERWPGPRRLVFRQLGPILPGIAASARGLIPEANLRLDAAVDHATAVAEMRLADGLVLLLSEQDAGEYTMTGKVFEYLAARRPILVAGPASAAGVLVSGLGAGLDARLTPHDALVDAILEAGRRAVDPERVGPSEARVATYDRRVQAGTWAELLRAQLEERSARSHGKG